MKPVSPDTSFLSELSDSTSMFVIGFAILIIFLLSESSRLLRSGAPDEDQDGPSDKKS